MLHFASSEFTVRESEGTATITVRCSPAPSVPVTVRYATSDLSATAGRDYLPQSGTLAFAAGQPTNAFTVPVNDSFSVEPARLVELTLSAPTGGAVLGQRPVARLVVQDDERPVALDPSFDSILAPGSWVNSMVVQRDGKIILGGNLALRATGEGKALIRLNPDGSFDADFKEGATAKARFGSVFALALDEDGNVLVGGGHWPSAETVGPLNIFRLLSDGTLDESFQGGLAARGFPSDYLHSAAISPQPDGCIYVLGDSSLSSWRGITRLKPDGAEDTTFNPGSGGSFRYWGGSEVFKGVSAVAVQPDGKLVIGGKFTSFDGASRGGIARLHSDGSLDTTFPAGSGVSYSSPSDLPRKMAYVTGVALQPDGKVLLGGYFDRVNDVERVAVARLNPDGTLDSAFDLRVSSWVTGYYGASVFVPQPDGRILFGGYVRTLGGSSGLIRLNPDGSLDPTLLCPRLDGIMALQVQPSGDILVAGEFTEIDGAPQAHLARLFGDTTQPRTVEWGQRSHSVAEDAAAVVLTVVRGGNSSEPHTVSYMTSDGSATAGADYPAQSGTITLAPGENSKELTLTILDDARMEEVESFHVELRDPSAGVWVGARSRAEVMIRDNEISAMVDSTFSPDIEGFSVNAVAIQADGKLLLAGEFRRVDGVPRSGLARLNADGSLDLGFVARVALEDERNCCLSVRGLVVQPDGQILVSGNFQRVDDWVRKGIVRLNPDGSLDPTFTPPAELDGATLYPNSLQPDGRLLVGSHDGRHGGLHRLNVDGTRDPTFRSLSVPWYPVALISAQDDGTILVAGQELLTRLHADGSPDLSYLPELCGPQSVVDWCRVMALNPDGTAIVSGRDAGGSRATLFRLNADGSLDPSFRFEVPLDPLAWGYSDLESVAVAPDGKVLVTGRVSTAHGDSWSARLSRFNADGSLDRGFPQITIGAPYGSSQVHLGGGRVIVSGSFEGIGGHTQAHLAVLRPERSGATVVQFAQRSFVAGESAGSGFITVQRVGDVSGATTVGFAAVPGTGISGRDYLPITGSLTFGPLEAAKMFAVSLLDNPGGNPDRTVLLSLSNPGGGALLSREHATLRILDDDHPGSLDLAFDAGLQPGPGSLNRPWTNGVVDRVLVLPDGRIRVWGDFAGRFVQLNPDGSRDRTYTDMTPYELAHRPDGTSYGFSVDAYNLRGGDLLRFHADGSVDPAFKVTVGPDTWGIQSAAASADGKVLIGGGFSRVNGIHRSGIARLNADGSLDATFDPGTGVRDGEVLAIAPQADGRILIGGSFTSVNGTARNGLARLNADGSLDPTFVATHSIPNSPGAVASSLVSLPDGSVLALGSFPTLDPTGAKIIVRFRTDGSLDSVLELDAGTLNGFVFWGYNGTRAGHLTTMALQPNGGLLVVGEFLGVNGVPRFSLVRLKLLSWAAEPPRLELVGFAADGAFVLGIRGQPEWTYRIEASPDLQTWTLLEERASAGVLTEFKDAAAASATRRFYRVRRH